MAFRLYHTFRGIIAEQNGKYYLLNETSWDTCINREHLYQYLLKEMETAQEDASLQQECETNALAPIKSQEVWASGVTYLRSREARMEEAKDAGGGDFYARVYEAERPELFFKATAAKVVGPGGKVHIRRDSHWNVPEPELTLFISSEGTIEGYTIGNDMSSRDIEGENPLYLPQAKSYDASAALGPCLYVPEAPIYPDTGIVLEIFRKDTSVFKGSISINRMKRKHTELAAYLFRETSFPNGVYLMTGTGIVPPDDFSLGLEDEVRISIDGIGTLINRVGQR
ncbi:MAG: fumarylacetoacetate hydrolase family protein [Flavisolibacter sp.]|nr:fumarylacetoacetate hydrolase family protein [Flavisolibacter sp.]